MNPVEVFIEAIDRAWPAPAAPRIELRVLGSSALFLHCDYQRGTKDSDVLETAQVSGDVVATLKRLAGKGTPLHERHRLYLDVLGPHFPFLPQEPRWWPRDDLTRRLTHFSVAVLDPTDVVISKLPRFHANDVQDIREVVLRGLVDHAEFVMRFRSAIDGFAMDARADDFPRYVRRLHQVERDFFGVGESEIDLPSWVTDG